MNTWMLLKWPKCLKLTLKLSTVCITTGCLNARYQCGTFPICCCSTVTEPIGKLVHRDSAHL